MSKLDSGGGVQTGEQGTRCARKRAYKSSLDDRQVAESREGGRRKKQGRELGLWSTKYQKEIDALVQNGSDV